MIEACFDKIEEVISSKLSNAQNRINVAVAWFTNERLLERLKCALDNKVEVCVVVLDDILNRSEMGLDFGQLISKGADVRMYNATNNIMHHKFCVIDDVVITGSYNWTYFANTNKENIIVTNSSEVVEDYVKQFHEIFELSSKVEEPYKQKSWDNVNYKDFLALRRYIYKDVKADTQIPESWQKIRIQKLIELDKAIPSNDKNKVAEASCLPISEKQTSLMDVLINNPRMYEKSLWEEEHNKEINKAHNEYGRTSGYFLHSEKTGGLLNEFVGCYLIRNNKEVKLNLFDSVGNGRTIYYNCHSVKIKIRDSDFIKTMEMYSSWEDCESGVKMLYTKKVPIELLMVKYVGYYFFKFDKPQKRDGRDVYGLYVIGISKTNKNGKEEFYEGWDPKERFEKIKIFFLVTIPKNI